SGVLVLSFLLELLKSNDESAAIKSDTSITYMLSKPFNENDMAERWPKVTEEERQLNVTDRLVYDQLIIMEISEFEKHKIARIREAINMCRSVDDLLNLNKAYSKAMLALLSLEARSNKPFQIG
ncbi:MAG: hypothetical protein U9Q38_06740, partial [Thermodesulfobacteriota bacterium]|nr:hypothetical protein [Thermodesulfobacteriota bacterium]